MASIYRTDSIQIDTSRAPWMKFALDELGKSVKELRNDRSFEHLLYEAIANAKRNSEIFEALEGRSRYRLLVDSKGNPLDLLGSELSKADKARGDALARANPEIAKYFDDLTTDPALDKKGRSWSLSPVYRGNTRWEMTAWCAAFVNWCLVRARAPHLGVATAASWLRLGTPLPAPVYGCITIIPPGKSTGSTTGHVAFYEKTIGDHVVLIGGNQNDPEGDKVSRMKARKVMGYRWPTQMNHYLLPDRPGTATA